MKYHTIILLLIIAPFFLSTRSNQNKKAKPAAADNWSGTVTWSKTSKSTGKKVTDDHGHENVYRWNFSFEFQIDVNFINGRGTVVRTDKTSRLEKDSLIFVHPENKYMIEEKTTSIKCDGKDVSELSVEFSEDNKTYWISFSTPNCPEQMTYEVKNNIHGNTSNQSVNDREGIQITLPAGFSGQPVGNDPNTLSGTFEEIIPATNEGGGDIITKATWNLTRGASKPELIVTPYGDDADYDDWMPEPGADELTKGNALKVQLHLQESGGGSALIKAKSFELRLSKTSMQPGICLNTPLVPSVPKPDLRFLPQAKATISQEDQFIKIPCDDGENGEVVIGSFDGGGWTILNAEAILENNTRIKGVLEQDKTKKDIPIPKNNAGGKIAERWLQDNGRPGETDDNETSQGNRNNGDGLTAYEEYRGVISEGKFKRLDPKIKELGVKLKKSDLSIFSEGLQKFENVTGFKIVRFYENEIPANRRTNQNASYANSYKQFALNLITGSLPAGESGKAFGSPGIPSQVNPVTIDLNNIRQGYQNDQAEAARMNTTLPYSEKEMTATVVAHELAHGVNVPHHGTQTAVTINQTFVAGNHPAVRIFLFNGNEYLTRPVAFGGKVGTAGNVQSGDLTCIMVSNSLCNWAFKETPDTTYFYEVPIIPLGIHLCTSPAGTKINAGGKYFGDAPNGKCEEQLKLK